MEFCHVVGWFVLHEMHTSAASFCSVRRILYALLEWNPVSCERNGSVCVVIIYKNVWDADQRRTSVQKGTG